MIWLLMLALLVVIAGAAVLYEGTFGEAELDPFWHTFKPDSVFGPVARCGEWIEEEGGGLDRCGLSYEEHEEVYGNDRQYR